MNPFTKLFNSRTVKNASQVQDGFTNYSNTNSLYTRDITKYFEGVNTGGQYDNFYGDYNRIITTAPTFPIYYTDSKGRVEDKGEVAQYLEKPNEDYPQFKVLQQIYSEMITKGYSDIFLWRKDGKKETELFDDKQYPEADFRGCTLVSGYDQSRLSKLQRKNIVRIQYGVSQDNVFMGYSPTQAAQAWRKMQDSMGLHMTAFAKNAGMPLGQFIITAPSPEDFVKLRDSLQSKIAGAKNNGKVLYNYRPSSVKDAQIEWVQFTSKDVQDYTPQLEFSEKKMSQNFGVPGTIKGTNDGETYASARVSEQVFIKYTIKPLVDDFKAQLSHAIKKRFNLKGEIKVNIVIPEVADESLVRIRATTSQVALFDQKRAEGYTAESIVHAYNLPESFLLLELQTDADNAKNNPKTATKRTGNAHTHVNKNELLRVYQNKLSKEELEALESSFREITEEYADLVLKNGIIDGNRIEYEGAMTATFSIQYAKLYDLALKDVADSLVEILGAADIADLNLTDEELEEAAILYRERVANFSRTFTEDVAKLPGTTLEVRKASAEYNIDRVVVTESEHARIVSELKSWTKSEEKFPVRVTKKWNTLPGACKYCLELEDVEIDVTALFINDPNISEIYEVQGGGLHPNCRCYVTYVMEGSDVRDFEGKK